MRSVTVLVVDDDDQVRDLVAEQLRALVGTGFVRSLGFDDVDVLTASDALQALHQLQSQQVDAMFLDLSLPQLDGLEFLEMLAAQEEFSRLPVTICSGICVDVIRREAKRYGAVRCLQKPFAMEELAESLRVMLERRRCDERVGKT